MTSHAQWQYYTTPSTTSLDCNALATTTKNTLLSSSTMWLTIDLRAVWGKWSWPPFFFHFLHFILTRWLNYKSNYLHSLWLFSNVVIDVFCSFHSYLLSTDIFVFHQTSLWKMQLFFILTPPISRPASSPQMIILNSHVDPGSILWLKYSWTY